MLPRGCRRQRERESARALSLYFFTHSLNFQSAHIQLVGSQVDARAPGELRGRLRLCARDEDFLEEEGPDDETAGQSPGTSASSTLILVSSQCNWARASADDLSKKDHH